LVVRKEMIFHKKRKIILISIASMVGLLITFGIIDYYRVMNGRKPVFAIQIVKYKNGGSIQYLGLD